MAPNQRPMDDSQVISPWGMAVRNLSPEAGQAVGRVQHRTRSHRSSQGYARGERHPNAKLSDSEVKQIIATVERWKLKGSVKGLLTASIIFRTSPHTIRNFVQKITRDAA